MPIGPYKSVTLMDGRTAPWYIVPFDKAGTCTAPLTRKHLVDSVAADGFSDIFLFSHGWNNDWETASERYEEFIGGFIRMRAEQELPFPQDYRPLLIGLFWPSTALVLPWEQAPDFAARAPGAAADDSAVAEYWREIEDLGADLPSERHEEFYALAQQDHLEGDAARRFAEILGEAFGGYAEAERDAGEAGELAVEPEALLRLWRQIPTGRRARKPGEFGRVGNAGAGPDTAGGLDFLDPRGVIRLATVLKMKDRAGTVGARGVGLLLREVVSKAPEARVHLVGHSYGCIVVLSALCHDTGDADPPTVQSVLLLQPAVSQWCFAKDVAGEGYSGGYCTALERVRQPIFATFSRNDFPLRRAFHLTARRPRDLGQPQIAAGGLPSPPSRYAALGGYGPAGLGAEEYRVVEMWKPPRVYTPDGQVGRKLWALNGDAVIAGHGDISSEATWWALHNLVGSDLTNAQ
jgi:hypothetical protein